MKYLMATLLSMMLVMGLGLSPATTDSHAQAKFKAGIAGRLTDWNGAVIVGANISLTVRATRKVIYATTNDSGEYVADLEPGAYDVEADAPGFKKAKRKNIPVHPEARSFVDFVLESKPPEASSN